MRSFDPAFVIQSIPKLLAWLPVTLLVLAATVVIGSVLGLALARAGHSRTPLLRNLAAAYVGVVRCTPPIIMLFIIYYGLPLLMNAAFGIDINSIHKALFVILSFSLLFSANMAEIMRSAYGAVDRGQTEAALSVGMSPVQAFVHIVLPQATVSALPNFTNSLINLMKDGSLAYTIGLLDMMGQGTLIISRNHGAYSLEIYTALALIYWLLTVLIEKLMNAWEARLSVGSNPAAVQRRVNAGSHQGIRSRIHRRVRLRIHRHLKRLAALRGGDQP